METFDNEISDDEDFEDELLPVATPVYLQQPSGLPPPVSSTSTPSYDSSQFDPFAPQGNTPSNDNNNVLDLLSTPNTTSDAPVLIPMNPDADGDLLGGSTIITKQARKETKDPKMKNLLYDDDDDDDLLMTTNNATTKEEEETADNFVDDDENAKGGFFSRLGNKIRSTPTKEASKPTDTESDTNMEVLQGGGNSLPHPDTLVPGSSRDHVQEENSDDDDSSINSSDDDDDDDDDEDGLDGNGKSLPHPDEVMRLKGKKKKKEEPEEMQLDENGMSLPHPETIIPLRPPSQQDVLLKTLNEDDNSGGSSQSGDNARLMAALEAAGADSDSDEDMYIEDAEEESEHSSSSSESGHYLDGNGNSLPHPDEHAINKSSGHGMSSKWKNLRTSFRSTFNKNQKMDRLESEDEKEFADEEGRFMGSSRKGDEEMGYSDGDGSESESESESDSDSDFDDEDPSKKARMLSLVKEQSKNPRTQLICLVSLIVFILLFIVTPVAVNKKKKNNEIVSTGASGTSVAAPTQPPFSFDGAPCYDEIVLTDRDGKDLVNGTDTSEDIACYSVDEPIHFRFKRCRPASPLDWVGVFSSRSMFMDKLWKDHYDGLYLCGDQPCPKEDPNNKEGGPPRVQTTKAPPITAPGEYRLFLVKDSDWPYEFVKHTAAFHVVESSQLCANKDNIFSPPKSLEGESVYIDLPTEVPTGGLSSYTSLNSIGTRK